MNREILLKSLETLKFLETIKRPTTNLETDQGKTVSQEPLTQHCQTIEQNGCLFPDICFPGNNYVINFVNK